jgi:hypothetical protein
VLESGRRHSCVDCISEDRYCPMEITLLETHGMNFEEGGTEWLPSPLVKRGVVVYAIVCDTTVFSESYLLSKHRMFWEEVARNGYLALGYRVGCRVSVCSTALDYYELCFLELPPLKKLF